EFDDAIEGDLVGAHQQFGDALIGPADEMDFRRATGSEHIERGARLVLPAQTPATAGFGIEKKLPFHDPLGPGIAVAIGEENYAELRADRHRLLNETAARESFVVRVRSEIQEAIRGMEAKRIGHVAEKTTVSCGDRSSPQVAQ